MRCNAGINPSILCDQHLMAEQSELLIVDGMLRRYNFQMKSPPKEFTLGKGHILFWTDKILYLHKRHQEIKKEIKNRGYKVSDKSFILNDYPPHLLCDWHPTQHSAQELKSRITEKMLAKGNKLFWRFRGEYIDFRYMPAYINKLQSTPIYYV